MRATGSPTPGLDVGGAKWRREVPPPRRLTAREQSLPWAVLSFPSRCRRVNYSAPAAGTLALAVACSRAVNAGSCPTSHRHVTVARTAKKPHDAGDAGMPVNATGVPAPSVRKPTVRQADKGRPHPVLRRNPPILNARLETLRKIMASNSQWAQCSPPSRRIVRNETGSDPWGPTLRQIPHPWAIEGVKRASPLRRAGPSTLRPIRYRRFSQTWGCYPSMGAGVMAAQQPQPVAESFTLAQHRNRQARCAGGNFPTLCDAGDTGDYHRLPHPRPDRIDCMHAA